MAGKRPGRRILLPDDGELDRPVEDIKKGSTFVARSKEVRNNIDEEPKARGTYVDNGREGGVRDPSQQMQNVDIKSTSTSGENKETEKGPTISENTTSADAGKDAVQNEAAVK